MKNYFKIMIIGFLILFISCSKDDDNAADANTKTTNYLTMKINGIEWKSDGKGVFGAFHPTGYNDVIIISGIIGDGAKQQGFNMNLYRTTGVGEYVFSNTTEAVFTTDRKVVQLANLSAQDYLYGGTLGLYKMKVKVLKASKNPEIVEATFEGTLKGVRGDEITLTEGKFYYKE